MINRIFNSVGYKLIADLSGIIFTISLFISGIKEVLSFLLSFYIQRPQLAILLSIILLWGFIATIHLFINKSRQSFKEYQQKEEDKIIKRESSKIVSSSNKNLKNLIIPSQRYLETSFSSFRETANEWDEKSILTQFNLYIRVQGNKIDYSIQSFFYSKLKNAQMSIYTFSKTPDYEEADMIKNKTSIKPFFEQNIPWEKAILKSYQSVSEEVGDSFRISLHSDEDCSIIIWYQTGKISKKRWFKIKENTLIDEKTEKAISL